MTRTAAGNTAVVRPEAAADIEGVRLVNERAFESSTEAALVGALRGVAGAISLVAALGDRIIGHILFTPVQVDGHAPALSVAGLAPMAVLPEYQRQGIGSRLIEAGLDACRASRYDAVVVVGHPEYYPKFGFVPAWTKGLECEFSVPPEAFMVLEVRPGALDSLRGVVKYRPEFSAHA